MNKFSDVKQKNWKSRKKNGKWMFLCSLFIFSLGIQTALPIITEQHMVFAADKNVLEGIEPTVQRMMVGALQEKPFDAGMVAEKVTFSAVRKESDPGYIYWTYRFANNTQYDSGYYSFTIPNTVGSPERVSENTPMIIGVNESGNQTRSTDIVTGGGITGVGKDNFKPGNMGLVYITDNFGQIKPKFAKDYDAVEQKS